MFCAGLVFNLAVNEREQTESKQAELELRIANARYARQGEALIALTRLAASSNGPEFLREIAEVTARTIQVPRVSIWRIRRDRRTMECVELYELAEGHHSEGVTLPENECPAYFRALAENDVIVVEDAQNDLRTSELSPGYSAPLHIGAMLDAPVRLQGTTMGVLCCEHLDSARNWTADEQTFAVAVANLVSLIFAQEERKKLEAQYLRAQRMESIGTLASGVAHDLNNILAPILISAPLLRTELTPEERDGIVTTIVSSAERGAAIVKQVLAFGRGMGGEKHPLQVGAIVKDVARIMRETFPKNIEIESACESHLWSLIGDATQVNQVLLNLCVNARDAMPDGGKLRLEAANFHVDASCASMLPAAEPGSYVVLKVSDTGRGIPPEIVDHIFDPFFTTKGVGKGTGLGLSTVHGIVEDHGGFVDLNSDPAQGTTVAVYFPADPHEESDDAPTTTSGIPRGHGELLMVVDDELPIAAAVKRALETHGYEVILAADGTEAIAVFADHRDRVVLVISDLQMPFMDGVTLIRSLLKMKPGLRVIASTGLGENARLGELKGMGVETVLNKPYGAPVLLRAITDLLTKRA